MPKKLSMWQISLWGAPDSWEVPNKSEAIHDCTNVVDVEPLDVSHTAGEYFRLMKDLENNCAVSLKVKHVCTARLRYSSLSALCN